jgi:streptogramin lyase
MQGDGGMRYTVFILGIAALLLTACQSDRALTPIPVKNVNAHPLVFQPGQRTHWKFFPVQTSYGDYLGQITGGFTDSIWYTAKGSNAIGRMAMDGSTVAYTVPTPNSLPLGITKGPDGQIWFTETQANQIGSLSMSGIFTEFALPTHDSQPLWITTGPDGNLWFTEQEGQHIGRMTTSGIVTEFGSDTGYRHIVSGPDGNLWFTDMPDKIGKISTSGVITLYTLPTAQFPDGLTVGGDGNIWFVNELAPLLGKINTAGTVSEYPGCSGITDSGSTIAAGSDGKLYATILNNTAIMQFTLSGACKRLAFQTRYTEPGAIAAGPDGNLWFTGYPIHGNAPKIGVYIVRVLSATPPTMTFTSPGQTQLETINETQYTGTWTASSSDPTIATVTATSNPNVFQVMSVGVGSTTIIIADQDQNSIGVPVVVQ